MVELLEQISKEETPKKVISSFLTNPQDIFGEEDAWTRYVIKYLKKNEPIILDTISEQKKRKGILKMTIHVRHKISEDIAGEISVQEFFCSREKIFRLEMKENYFG